jgi:hypothetical protein
MTPEQGKLDTQDAEALLALERFVVENDDLLALESLIGKFNIFDALDIARVEIRHSNFLAFLLDPAESHGQGQLFLKAVLMDLLKEARAELRPFSPIELDGTDLRGVDVRREWGHIDLLITCQQPAFVIVIENKVGSHEHSNQLGRYETTIKDHYPDARPLYVYLTPKSDEPSQDAWVPYSYADIHRVLTRVRTTYNNAIGEDVLVFLDHYLSLIGTRFMNNEIIDELCQRIHKNHRRALELIFERVGSPASGVLAEADTVLREDPRWHVFYRQGNIIDFVPKAWLEWLPPVGLDRKDDARSWFILRFELYVDDGKLDFYVEVRRMADLAKRRAIVDLLIKEGERFGFRHSGHKVKDNYTRVSGRERVLKWNKDDEPGADSIQAAVKKKLDEIFPKLQDAPMLLKPLFIAPNSAT